MVLLLVGPDHSMPVLSWLTVVAVVWYTLETCRLREAAEEQLDVLLRQWDEGHEPYVVVDRARGDEPGVDAVMLQNVGAGMATNIVCVAVPASSVPRWSLCQAGALGAGRRLRLPDPGIEGQLRGGEAIMGAIVIAEGVRRGPVFVSLDVYQPATQTFHHVRDVAGFEGTAGDFWAYEPDRLVRALLEAARRTGRSLVDRRLTSGGDPFS